MMEPFAKIVLATKSFYQICLTETYVVTGFETFFIIFYHNVELKVSFQTNSLILLDSEKIVIRDKIAVSNYVSLYRSSTN